MQRYLVAINYDGPHDRLAAEVRALALGDDAQFHIVVPAVSREGRTPKVKSVRLHNNCSTRSNRRSTTCRSSTATSATRTCSPRSATSSTDARTTSWSSPHLPSASTNRSASSTTSFACTACPSSL